MHEPLRIELDDPAQADSLRHALGVFHAETVHRDGHAEVRVELIESNPERRVTDALNVIDTWLARSGTANVRVHLDGHVYTLHAPRPLSQPA